MDCPFRFVPRLESGVAAAAYPGIVAGTAITRPVMVFTEDVDGYADGDARVPTGVTVTSADVVFEVESFGTGISRWSVHLARVTTSGDFDPSSLTGETAQDIDIDTARERFTVSFTGIGITVAAGDIILCRFFHEGAHTNDTLGSPTLFSNPRLVLTLS